MGLIPQSFIDELIARADIVEVIGSRVPLKKAGREYKACCPFHSEKSASFWVSPEKQFYHCFGCGAHGTVLRFLMEHDHMPFPEAVEELATRLGLEVPHEGGNAPAVNDASMSRYMRSWDALRGSIQRRSRRDARAQAYVAKRGLDRETVEQFGIGYAPNSWNEVLRRFGGTEEARRALSDLGLIIERERGQIRDGDRHYDRFRDRIMFPIRDSRGRIIAFGGRILDQGEPKYLNSPETVLFHKGRELYGLYETRRARSNLKRLLIVEGYMDAVRLHQSGINYAVATLGTATTPEHFKRIFRLVSEVVFAFDGDRAGRAAAWRALQHALPEARQGREIRFLFLPEGHDPDSLVGEEGARGVRAAPRDATLPLSEYLIRELSEQSDLSSCRRTGALLRAGPPAVGQATGRRLSRADADADRRSRGYRAAAPRRSCGAGGNPGDMDGCVREPPAQHTEHVFPSGMSAPVAAVSFRQAVVRLVRYPAIAQQVTEEERAAPGGVRGARDRAVARADGRPAGTPGAELGSGYRALGRQAGRRFPAKATSARGDRGRCSRCGRGNCVARWSSWPTGWCERRLEALEEKSRSSRLEPEELRGISTTYVNPKAPGRSAAGSN